MAAIFLLSSLFLSLAAVAEEGACDLGAEQKKVISELAQHVESVGKKLREKDKKKGLGFRECDEITDRSIKQYRELVLLTYKNYRHYLNGFLEEATAEAPEIKSMKKFVEYLREGDGLPLMKRNAELDKKSKEAIHSPDWEKTYTKLNEKASKAHEELEKLMYSKYKTLRKNIANKHRDLKREYLPTTDHNCSYYDKDKPQKVLDRLVLMTPQLSIYHNVCSENPYDYYPHPEKQKVITFQLNDGRAMVWYCDQSFESKRSPPKSRGNYGPYGETMVTSKASCLAYDLLNDRWMLGDQKQSHLAYESNPYIDVKDKRLELARALGKEPLSFADYVNRTPKDVPEAPEKFFSKVVPKECHFWGSYKRAIESTKNALVTVENPVFGSPSLEY